MSEQDQPRSAEEVIKAQRAALISDKDQRAFRDRILERHSREHVRTDPGTNRKFAVGEIEDRKLPLFVVWDHILVRREDARRAKTELASWPPGFDGPRRIDCGNGIVLPVVRFQAKTPASIEQMEAAVTALHKQKINASFNHVLPDGGIKGGQGLAAVADPARVPGGKPRTRVGAGVTVAVIDTGIAQTATARKDKWITDIAEHTAPVEYDTLDEDQPENGLDAGAGHGTFVAGVIRQVAPAADVRIYRALDSDGIGSEEGIACSIVRAWRDGATIINLSLGQESYHDHPPVALAAALDLISDDVIVVAAAGNLGAIDEKDPAATRPHWPAAFRRVVGVGALDSSGAPATWSKRGAWVDVSTRGEDIVSTFVDGTPERTPNNPQPATFPAPNPWATWLGTSFAAPQIAGLLAAKTSQGKYRRRIPVRHALGELLASGWYHHDFGILIESPLA